MLAKFTLGKYTLRVESTVKTRDKLLGIQWMKKYDGPESFIAAIESSNVLVIGVWLLIFSVEWGGTSHD